jgi:predicted RecA/RadA family phage recombinase
MVLPGPARTSAANQQQWYSVTYGNGLFVAVSQFRHRQPRHDLTRRHHLDLVAPPPRTTSGNSVTYGNGLFVAVAYWSATANNRVMTSPDGITWTSRTSAADNEWQSVTYGNGLFVAVAASGSGNRVMTSPDGITWTSRTSAADNEWQSVTYGNGLFVAVAQSGTGNRVMTSSANPSSLLFGTAASTTNLTIFSPSTLTAPSNTLSVSGDFTNGGTFDANNGTTTFNGASAQTVSGSLTGASAFHHIYIDNTSGNGTTTQSVNFDSVASSTGTFTITASTSVSFAAGATSTFTNVMWDGGTGATTTDPIWIYSTVTGTQANFAVSGTYFIRNAYIRDTNVCGSTGGGLTATNTVNVDNNTCWTFVYEPGEGGGGGPTLILTGTLYNDEGITPITSGKTIKLVIGTTTIATATTTSNGSGLFSFSTSTNNIATGTPLVLFVDADGTTRAALLTKATSSVSNITGLNLYKDHVIAKSGAGTTTNASDFFFYDSADDSDLQYTASSSIGRLTVASGQKLFVASSSTFHLDRPIVSHHFMVATSATAFASSTLSLTGNYHNAGTFKTAAADAAAWTSRTSAVDNSWQSVTYGNGLFVAVSNSGTNNHVMTSPDGITWTSRNASADNAWESVTYGNGLFVAVSMAAGVMTSPDGITWTSRTPAAVNFWNSVTYGNSLFVAVSYTGTGNRVMTSPDGITWTSRTSAADNSWFSITYGNGLFVAVSVDRHRQPRHDLTRWHHLD